MGGDRVSLPELVWGSLETCSAHVVRQGPLCVGCMSLGCGSLNRTHIVAARLWGHSSVVGSSHWVTIRYHTLEVAARL
jgi:hypothetical protein